MKTIEKVPLLIVSFDEFDFLRTRSFIFQESGDLPSNSAAEDSDTGDYNYDDEEFEVLHMYLYCD